ncbi:hypothetical protein [Prosthecomicrobium sp. N25]|uniref:hypothetical protein n=1 Tax=Prosthecomicrobium sp. N25 TaxID=3129254 RepID=UPI003076DD0E
MTDFTADDLAARGATRSTAAGALGTAALALLSLALLAGLALRIMTFDLRKDELMYVPPVRLLDTMQIYRDFFYNHVPGTAWYFHGLAKLSGVDNLLLTGRVGILIGWVFFLVALFVVSYAFTRSGIASWSITILTVCNELFLSQTGMAATNNFLPLPFSYLGLALFILGLRAGGNPGLVFLAGFMLALGASMKISAVVVVPVVVLAALLLPRGLSAAGRLVKVLLPLGLGGILGGLPILVPLARDPAGFMAHVVAWHRGPHVAYWKLPEAADEGAAVTAGAKVLLAHEVWLGGSVALALVGLVAVLLLAFRREPEAPPRTAPVPGSLVAVVALAGLVGIVMSFVPTPGFPQYFAPPLALLPLLVAMLFARLGPEGRGRASTALLAAALVALVVNAPRLAQAAPSALKPERWEVARVHAAGLDLARRMAAAGATGKVATLNPIYPLEGRLPVYAELATGPFAYRTGDLTPPDLAQHYRFTSPTQIEALLQKDPPAAVLLGFDKVLEAPLARFAEANGYVKVEDFAVKDRFGTLALYLKPGKP